MTKIEQFNEAKQKAEKLRTFADTVADRKHADKYKGTVTVTDLTLGTYGSSSVYLVDDEIRRAITEELCRRLREVAAWAAETAEEEARNCAMAAEAEAYAVLQEVQR